MISTEGSQWITESDVGFHMFSHPTGDGSTYFHCVIVTRPVGDRCGGMFLQATDFTPFGAMHAAARSWPGRCECGRCVFDEPGAEPFRLRLRRPEEFE